jgi:diguanylate cyclase (GGDEF)-like protein/PAS domain S-box-containing protein
MRGSAAPASDVNRERTSDRNPPETEPRVPGLGAALDNLSQGFAMFAADHTLTVCNKAYAEIYGMPLELTAPGTLLRDILAYRAASGVYGGDVKGYVAQVIATTVINKTSTDEYTLPNGRIVFISHRPLPSGGWVSLHEDITARRLAERESQQRIQTQNLQLDAAIENMSHGLAMFDRDQRLIVCNNLYAEFYGLPPELVRPGTLLSEIVEYRVSRGIYKGKDPKADMARILATVQANLPTRNEFSLPDGRMLAVTHRPMADGGWVATFEDITVQKRAEQELNRTKTFVDSVIEHVPVAILVREPETFRYVLINRAAEQFVGISRDQVLGKTAYDIFPRERADLISAHDAQALKDPDVPLQITDHAIQIPGREDRIVTTKKLTLRDQHQEALCLIAVIEDVTEKRKAEEQIAFLAHHDALTGLPNRAQFSERLEDALDWVARGSKLAVLFLDLDHFKTVNDTLGHFIGDELLKAVADRLRQCLRNVDLIGRLGGDEFAIVQTAIEQPGDAAALALRIQEAIKAPYDLCGIQAVVDVSIGIALAPNDATDATEVMKRADMALYQAKSEGRSRYRFFEPAMDAAMKARRKLDTELRSALANDEFELYYQPVVDIRSNEIVGVEGLLRWHHPLGGTVQPAEFVPVAEESGLIIPIGEWVVRQACSDAIRWPEHIRVALNLSPVQFHSPNLTPTIINALGMSGIAPSRLELEITEDVLLKHDSENVTMLEQLRRLGVRIVMDDFGTGYSSLNYLRRFPFDKVKIDRSFVNDLTGGNAESRAIVQAVVALATALKVSTTAEGVETEEQLSLVRAAGCTEYQGYLFSAPRPARDIARLFPLPEKRSSSAA